MKNYLIIAALLAAVCCTDHNNDPDVCGVADPVNNLPWLKTEIEQGDYASSEIADYTIVQAEYESRTVFYTQICCPTCDVAPPDVKSCNGEVVGTLYVDIAIEELHHRTIILETHNDVCE